MKKFKSAQSSLFLTELIIAILFFSLGSAICVQAFAKAYTTVQTAQELSFASSQVSSAASVIKYTDHSLESLQEYFPFAVQTEDSILICYDSSYNMCKEEEAVYRLYIYTEKSDIQVNTRLKFMGKDKTPLYELDLHYPL